MKTVYPIGTTLYRPGNCLVTVPALIKHRKWRVALADTRIIIKLSGSEKVLPLSEETPVIVRKSVSGYCWELAHNSGGHAKPIKVPYHAFPHLGKFFEKEGQDAVTVEADSISR